MEYGLEVFDAGGVNPRLRWQAPGAPIDERGMDRGSVAALRAQAAQSFSVAGASVGGLGAELYQWLDGPTQRWLATARSAQQGLLLRLPTAEGLGGLPWELLHEGGFLALDRYRPVIPIRTCTIRKTPDLEPVNRPLRLLFMACSPLDVEPVLDFEAEEAVILAAAKGLIEVVVEESGSLAGLRSTVEWFPTGYFDAIHISGHATVVPGTAGGPRFVMEDDTGAPVLAGADDIARALGGSWPRLVFVSGCSTAGSEAGAITSMAEALVDAGGPAVLGWALPVGDQAASSLAASLYGELARGVDIPMAVTRARITLEENHSPFWYLLRLFADASPLPPVVSRPGTPGRPGVRHVAASTLFLDSAGQVKVADRASFVGRRRELQQLLSGLHPPDAAEGPTVALIHGMGGLGKSSLTARLLDRMSPTHPHRAVWVGKVDPPSMNAMGALLNLSATPEVDQQVNKLLNQTGLRLADRLRYLMAGPLADLACVFVFDDFESGNLTPDGCGGHLCTPEALEVITALAGALKAANSRSRILITSRYDFTLPVGITVLRRGVIELSGNDLDKKLRLTRHLGPTSPTDPLIRDRAITVAAGVPRLIERLDSILETHSHTADAHTPGENSDSDTPSDDTTVLRQLADLEAAGLEYRDELALRQLLEAQSPRVCRVLVLAAVYEIAVPREAIAALSPEDPIDDDIDAAVAVGLLQTGLHPTTGEQRYLVSPLLRPLLDELPERLTPDALREAQQRGAHYLYQRWIRSDDE